jgi:hypothetical protein
MASGEITAPISIEVQDVGTNAVAAVWQRSDNIVIQ